VGALIVLVPVVVHATGAGSGSGVLDRQGWVSRTTSVTTTSTRFVDVPDMKVLSCSRGAASVTFSVNLTGAQAGFQVVIDHGATMQPGGAFFQAQGGTNAFSFTTTANVAPDPFDGHEFELQWRSPSGQPATLLRADLLAQWSDPLTCE
jgi:hypothetical protein